MADATHSLPHHSPILHIISAPFRAIMQAMIAHAEADPRLKQIERLNALSDAELTKRGLERDDIVRYVFRNYLVF
ncbi:DUF1127 domain-containing protein [Shimia sp.]|uniref:DUF1127 domain-containing protein n=1 Tax=Shimia sp. TaxID=1954381 RepID=UPI0035653783